MGYLPGQLYADPMEKILYTVDEVHAAGEAILAIDVRSPELFAKAHLPGAVNIPQFFSYLAFSSAAGLRELHNHFATLLGQAGVRAQDNLVVYDESLADNFGAACRAYWLLNYLGHGQVGALDGGLGRWQARGLPVSAGEEAPRPATTYQVRPEEAMMASKADVLSALQSAGVVLIDNRDREEWLGESSSPYGRDFAPRRGRIPGARWLEWQHFIAPDFPKQEFVSAEETVALCAGQAIPPDSDIIIYCFKGCRAAHTYVALRLAGFSRLRICPGRSAARSS